MAVKTALLCLDGTKICSQSALMFVFKNLRDLVKHKLYVHIYSGSLMDNVGNMWRKPAVNQLISTTSYLYGCASSHLPRDLDVSVLQYNPALSSKHKLSHQVELIATEEPFDKAAIENLKQKYSIASAKVLGIQYTTNQGDEAIELQADAFPTRTYDYCALGGTFDSIHSGHKVLLSAGIALSERKLTVGVTDSSMNSRKSLSELIQPVEDRKLAVMNVLQELCPDIEYDVVTLHDPFGPTVTDPNLQCLIVSEETVRGGEVINVKRKELGYPVMETVVIPLVQDTLRYEHQDAKISSSSIREERLGDLIRPPTAKTCRPQRPYVIGLTGGITSGKSSVGKTLESLGAGLISSDILAHESYRSGTAAHRKIIETFGEDILDLTTNEIDRRRLGAKVFGQPDKLKALNDIVWPATADLVEEKVLELYKAGKEVCFVEAALLLEAGWSDRLHEIWCCIIPEAEAVSRLKIRNKMTDEEALKRIGSQATNQYRVDNSNVVLCTLWDYPVTRKQVEKAWSLLQQRL